MGDKVELGPESMKRLNEVCDHLAAIRRAPIMAQPYRTIGLGILWIIAWVFVVGVFLWATPRLIMFAIENKQPQAAPQRP